MSLMYSRNLNPRALLAPPLPVAMAASKVPATSPAIAPRGPATEAGKVALSSS